LVVLKGGMMHCTIRIGKDALAVNLIVDLHAPVYSTVGPCVHAHPVTRVGLPFAFVGLATRVDNAAVTTSLAMAPLPVVATPVGIDNDSMSMLTTRGSVKLAVVPHTAGPCVGAGSQPIVHPTARDNVTARGGADTLAVTSSVLKGSLVSAAINEHNSTVAMRQ
jgi:hypothetical protein